MPPPGTFYTGPVAEAIASVCWLDEADLASHSHDWVEPLRFAYGGSHAARAAAQRPGRDRRLGARVARLARAGRPGAGAGGRLRARLRAIGGDTAYVCAADGEGMGVSLIQSIFYGFGSQVLVPGFGFMLQNRGSGFVLEDGHPNRFAPGKRPFHTIIPAALLDGDGRWSSVFGVTGGQYQPQGHVQVVVNLLDHGMGPQAALDAPRYRLQEDGTVTVESPLAGLRRHLRPPGVGAGRRDRLRQRPRDRPRRRRRAARRQRAAPGWRPARLLGSGHRCQRGGRHT